MKKKERTPLRYKIFFLGTSVLALLLLIHYARLMLFLDSERVHNGLTLPVMERGPIMDRHGRLLAVSIKKSSCTIWRPWMESVDQEVALLASVLDLDQQTLLRKVTTGANFQVIKRHLTQKESQAIAELLNQNKLPGVKLEQELGRSYPEKTLAAALIGYVGVDNFGLAGIEHTYNDVLSAPLLGDTGLKMGAEVWLTIDSTLQYYAQELAQETLVKNKASCVTILISEVDSGDILVWSSVPGFDANRFMEFNEQERSNVILTQAYEPGSVFKIFPLSILLDAGVIQATDTFDCYGVYQKRIASTGEVIRIKDLGSYGRLDVTGILRYSSNAGTGYASDRMDNESFEVGLRRFGFGSPTGISLQGETQGILRPSSSWSARSKPTLAMGQEIGVSALQMLAAASVLANEGILVKPQLVRKVVSSKEETLFLGKRQEVRQVIKPETARMMLGMLKETVETGTGWRAKIQGIEIAGKTGTAEEYDAKTGRYSDKHFIASILLYLPAKNPRYILYLTIQNPLGEILGGRIAAPVAKTMAERLIQHSGLPKEGETIVRQPSHVSISAPDSLVLGKILPDLTGFSQRALLPLFNRSDLQLRIQGKGWVVTQDPAPGTPMTQGMVITVLLE